MEERFDEFKATLEKIFSMDKEIIRMDNHFTNVCKAMLQTNGLRIVNLDEHSIF